MTVVVGSKRTGRVGEKEGEKASECEREGKEKERRGRTREREGDEKGG